MKAPRAFLEEAKRRCSPGEECPALLFGRGDVATKWRWMDNVLHSPAAFKLDPEEMYAALLQAEREGLELVAIFHTHPGPPAPSPHDLKYMAIWRVIWIIANVYTWEAAAWRIEGGTPARVPLEWL